MRDPGRISAAIHVLEDVLERHQPVRAAMRDWGKHARYAGAKDRAWVSGLVLDALRRHASLAWGMGEDDARGLVLAALRFAWDWPAHEIEKTAYEPHGPSPLTDAERSALSHTPDADAPAHARGDFPEWLGPAMAHVFGDEAVIEGQAMARRAPVDLRINTLKTTPERAARALASLPGAAASDLLVNAWRIAAPEPAAREASLEAIPAYSRGWVEVQDAGSQIAAAACHARPGEQVLDYCAGGGGKTLALAAVLEGKGQVFAYDIDARRLSGLVPRLRRSGARNVQLVQPEGAHGLPALAGAMDCVLVDAPCSGTGTWRRKPDTKWRLKPAQLAKRQDEQDAVLAGAAHYVKPGGRLVYVTCSFLMEEGEDRVAAFLAAHPGFVTCDGAAAAIASGQLTEHGADLVRAAGAPEGGVRLTPHRAGTDGFFFAVLRRDA